MVGFGDGGVVVDGGRPGLAAQDVAFVIFGDGGGDAGAEGAGHGFGAVGVDDEDAGAGEGFGRGHHGAFGHLGEGDGDGWVAGLGGHGWYCGMSCWEEKGSLRIVTELVGLIASQYFKSLMPYLHRQQL